MRKLIISASILVCIAATKIQAQRLPGVQKESVLASARMKIDGNANDWNNKFEAYNTSTSVFYSMANDHDNLYVIIKATDNTTIEKIFGGSITLTVKNLSNTKSPVPFSLTYPLLNRADRSHLLSLALDTPKSPISIVNNEFPTKAKEIAVLGCDGVVDSVISVYNEYGIKAAAAFDDSRAFTCEFAIPLKYLKRSIKNDTNDFNYNIKLNGIPIISNSPGMSETKMELLQLLKPSTLSSVYDQMSPTDLSGTYILAK